MTDYPRPKNDTGLGIHLGPNADYPMGRSDAEINRTIADMKAMGFTWAHVLVRNNEVGNWPSNAVKALTNAGIMPVLRLYTDKPYPANMLPSFYDMIRNSVSQWHQQYGVSYFMVRNEPNLRVEWQSDAIWDAMGSLKNRANHVAIAFLYEAQAILDGGGIPITPSLSPGGNDDDEAYWPALCDYWAANGKEVLKKCVIGVHNYHLNHPPDYPYDSVNQQTHPKQDLWSGGGASNCFLKYLYAERVFYDKMGFTIPVICNEGGARWGDIDDNRYPKIEGDVHTQHHVYVAKYMAERAEADLLCTGFWIFGARIFEAPQSPWETHSWRSPYHADYPVIQALKNYGWHARSMKPWSFEGQQNIIDITDSLPKGTTLPPIRPLSAIDKVVIHHSATSITTTPQQIAAYHVAPPPNGNGWPVIGYSFLVYSDGTIYQTNKLTTVSYHAKEANESSIGICFVGDFITSTPSPAQIEAGKALYKNLQKTLGPLDIKPHYNYSNTQCPGPWWTILAPPPPDDVFDEAGVRNAAWTYSFSGVIPLNEKSAYYIKARELKLGAPLSDEHDWGSYRFQKFAGGILAARIGDWAGMRLIGWYA